MAKASAPHLPDCVSLPVLSWYLRRLTESANAVLQLHTVQWHGVIRCVFVIGAAVYSSACQR